MIDTKETLKKLHTKFPTLSLDDLFTVLDCYTEQSNWTQPTIRYYGDSNSITANDGIQLTARH